MSQFSRGILFAVLMFASSGVGAQVNIQTSGTVVIVTGFGEVRHPNDEAHATLMIEEQDKDKSAAASRVNQKIRQGMEIIKTEDRQAILKTRGYYTYPIYPDDQTLRQSNNRIRQPVSWRVGQYLEVTTNNLPGLPKTIASVQRILALNGLYFSLSETVAKKLEEQRIAATYRNLTERIAAVAKAMGRTASDAVLETMDFEGSGAYAQSEQANERAPKMMRANVSEPVPVEEPSFEPGETILNMRVVGKVKFK
jgi:predicted secreted protein